MRAALWPCLQWAATRSPRWETGQPRWPTRTKLWLTWRRNQNNNLKNDLDFPAKTLLSSKEPRCLRACLAPTITVIYTTRQWPWVNQNRRTWTPVFRFYRRSWVAAATTTALVWQLLPLLNGRTANLVTSWPTASRSCQKIELIGQLEPE